MSKALAPRLVHGIAWHLLALVPIVLIAAASHTVAQERLSPEKRPDPAGVLLRYLNAPGQSSALSSPPRLFLSFGEARFKAVLDTGSTGVLITAAILPNWASLPSLGSARLVYSSSGRIMEGLWVVTPMLIVGQNGASVTTRPMPVMVVNRVRCVAQARDCTPQDNPSDIAMLGIGFARQGDGQLQSTPDRNPFLQISRGEAGLPRPGYVLTRSGVSVGLDHVGAYASFTTVQLTRNTRFPDWAPAPVCIALGSHRPAACGNLLVDTGVSRMFVTVPTAQLVGVTTKGTEGLTLSQGTVVDIQLGQKGSTMPGYTFHAGDETDATAPDGITLVHPGHEPTFLNTSLHFLNGFDYLYDADKGIVGYRMAH